MRKLFLFIILLMITVQPQQKRAITVDDLWAMKRILAFDVSPDGRTIAFQQATYSMTENKGNQDIYLVDSDGSNLRVFKNSDKNETEPQFSPDGKRLAYVVGGQIWSANLDGSDEKQLTDIYTEASGFKWSPDGGKILFVSSVYPDCPTQECNKQRDEEKENSKVKARVITDLMFRHWNEWREGKISHLFLLNIDKKEYTDLTYGSKNDVPPLALGSSNDYGFSPDGREISYTMNSDENIAYSTNNDVYTINTLDIKNDARTPSKKISTGKGNDNQPVFSPDGKYVAYVSMKRPGFEADKLELIIYDRAAGTSKNISEKFNLSVGEFIWSPDSKTIYFTSENEIYSSIFKTDLQGNTTLLLKEHINSALHISADGSTLYFKEQRTNLPDEIFSMRTDGSNLKQITSVNKELLSQLEMNPVETFWSKGAAGAKVQSIIVKPPFFDSSKTYPMIFLIHGGPQGHWEDDFHYRWNIQMFASQGYVVVATNPRGSTGYGQKFTDEISTDWGGKVYTDLMNACDYALDNYKFIDKKNIFAAGASYGGYMINWIQVNNTRFNALVCHDGVFNAESMWGTTEELWFPEWEFGGLPWSDKGKQVIAKWSPHNYIYKAKTPELIVQGALDFRVPESQAFQLFTSLKRLGVDTKLLYFPDEFHFVIKPQNAKLWWSTVYDWFNKYKKG